MTKQAILKEFQKLPNIGPRVAEDLYNLGYRTISSLKKGNPDAMYTRLEKLAGTHIDRCMLYTFRAIVYTVNHPHVPVKNLMWWKFKDTI